MGSIDKDMVRKEIISPLMGQEDFQNKQFVEGYVSMRIKNNNDPIPQYLPGTVEWRKWMDGWNRACMEIHIMLNSED